MPSSSLLGVAEGSTSASRKRRTASGTAGPRPYALSPPSPSNLLGDTTEAIAAASQTQHKRPSSETARKSEATTPSRRLPSSRLRDANIARAERRWQKVEILAKRAELSVERAFRRHGRYIARHPIHTLLVACLLITSLFYPAVGIFLWSSKGGPGVTRGDARSIWRSLSTPLLDSFASSGRKHHNSLRDLRMIWDDVADLNALDARDFEAFSHSMAAAEWLFGGHASDRSTEHNDDVKAPSCRSLRMEHIFVSTDDVIMGLGPRFGALHVPILRSTLNLQDAIEDMLIANEQMRLPDLPACVISPRDGRCLVLSPLAYWANNVTKLLADDAPAQTVLASTLNHTAQGVPLRLSTTLAGRSHLFQHLPRADHLALTFFLEDTQSCGSDAATNRPPPIDEESPSHRAWRKMLQNVTAKQVTLLGSDYRAARETILRLSPQHPAKSFPLHKALLIAAYVGMVIWLTRNFIKLRKVHSKVGLAFTACVELVISMTVAVSISALSGVRLTLLPWEILPFVIAVIGSENTFVLTNAIISTPVTLTVTSRVATGLERAGLPVAITVLSDVIIMALISVSVDVRPVRDFCIFAIFALLVDFVMQMTFYATVLTIDMQRLELADLLSLEPNTGAGAGGEDDDSTQSDLGTEAGNISPTEEKTTFVQNSKESKPSFIKLSCRAAWRARTARTASLSFLLALLFGLYIYHGSGYASKRLYDFPDSEGQRGRAWTAAQASEDAIVPNSRPTFDPFSHLSADGAHHSASPPQPWWQDTPSAHFWDALNPQHASVLSIRVEPWTVVSLSSASGQHIGRKSSFATWALFRPRIRALIWFLKLVVLPIAGTTSLLWVLLLYLLKDTELLDAQRHRQDAVTDDDDDALPTSVVDVSLPSASHALHATIYTDALAHAADVLLVAAEGKYVASVALDWTLRIWRLSKRGNRTIRTNLRDQLGVSFSQPTALRIAPVEGLLVIGHQSGAISILTLSTLSILQDSAKHGKDEPYPTQRVLRLLLATSSASPDEASVMSVHRDGSVWRRMLNRGGSKELVAATTTGCLSTPEVFARVSSEEQFVAVQSLGRELNVHRVNVATGAVTFLATLNCDALVIRTVAVGSRPDDKHVIAVGTADGQIFLHDVVARSRCTDNYPIGDSIRHMRFVEATAGNDSSEHGDLKLFVVTRSRSFFFEIRPLKRGGANDEQSNGTRRLPSSSDKGYEILGNGARDNRPSVLTTDGKNLDSPLLPIRYALHLLADVESSQGGAAILRAADGTARLVGVRRKSDMSTRRPGSLPEERIADRTRWEVFAVSLSNLPRDATSRLDLKGSPDSVAQRDWLKVMPLPLDEIAKIRLPLHSAGLAGILGVQDTPRAIQQRQNDLAFTQLAHVQAMPGLPMTLQARDGVVSSDHASQPCLDGLAFAFGTSLCVVIPSDIVP